MICALYSSAIGGIGPERDAFEKMANRFSRYGVPTYDFDVFFAGVRVEISRRDGNK